MKHPRVLSKLLNLTSNDIKVPTDKELDADIETLSWYIHVGYPLIKSIAKRKIKLFFRYKWRIVLRKFIVLSIFMFSLYYSYTMYMIPKYKEVIIHEKVSAIEKQLSVQPIPQGNLDFMIAISQIESNCNYKVYKGQYWGAYQMGDAARKDVGLGDMDRETFLNNPSIQDWAMNQYMLINYEYLKDIIIKHNIPKRGGIRVGTHLVTISGLIASAHLVGHGSVKQFFASNGKNVAVDGNNKPLTDYLQLNNIELEFNE